MTNRILILISFILVALGYVSYEAYQLDLKLNEYSQSKLNTVVSVLPDVSFKYFNDPSKNFELYKSSRDGNYLFIHFWATWCGPCEAEFPDLVKLTQQLKTNENIKFIFVAVNDQVKSVKKFLNKFKDQSNFHLVVDNESIFQNSFGSFKLPETFLFSPSGKLIKKFSGPQKWLSKEHVRILQELK